MENGNAVKLRVDIEYNPQTKDSTYGISAPPNFPADEGILNIELAKTSWQDNAEWEPAGETLHFCLTVTADLEGRVSSYHVKVSEGFPEKVALLVLLKARHRMAHASFLMENQVVMQQQAQQQAGKIQHATEVPPLQRRLHRG
jgi:hypothetical protein